MAVMMSNAPGNLLESFLQLEILEIYKASWKLPGSVWLFVINVPDSSFMSEVFNTSVCCVTSRKHLAVNPDRYDIGVSNHALKCQLLRYFYLFTDKLCIF